MPGCTACRAATASRPAPRCSASFAPEQAIDEEIRDEPRPEVALQRVGVVGVRDPVLEGLAAGLALGAVALEEGVENAGLRPAEMAVFQRELLHRLVERPLLMQEQVERGHEAGTV